MIELDPHPSHGRYTLRPVVDNDFDFLWQLKCDTLKRYIEALYGWDAELAQRILKRVMRGAHLVLVDDQPAGILKIELCDGFVHLAEIGLKPELQGQGLGTQIIRDVTDLADSLGYPVELQVFAANPAAKLYERLGFEVTHHKMYRPVSE